MLTLAIMAMGIATVVLSIVVACDFWFIAKRLGRPSRRLTTALSLQLFGECVIGLGTLTFSIAAHEGWLEHWSVDLQSAIRFAMFFATSATTIHLWAEVRLLRQDISKTLHK